jgi:hypothetical protein
MASKQWIKARICLTFVTSKFPFQEFVVWAEYIDRNVLLHYLDDIQQELDERLLLYWVTQ